MDLRFLTGKMAFSAALLILWALFTGCGNLGAGATTASGPAPVVSHPPTASFDASSPPLHAASRQVITDIESAAPEPSRTQYASLGARQSVVEQNTERQAAAKNQALLRRVEHVNDRSFQQKVLDSDEAVLVDFYADWCGPCKKLSPVLEELARETPGVRIVKVDIDRSPKLATSYRVKSIPTLILFKGGEPAARRGGLISKDSLRRLLGEPIQESQ